MSEAHRVTLKNIKHAAFASEETECFEATVYIDGVREGTVRNDGHGGCNLYHPRELEQKLDKIAATMPDDVDPRLQDPDDPEKPFTMKMNADLLVDEKVMNFLRERDLKRHLKKEFLYTIGDGKVYVIKPKSKATFDRLMTLGEDNFRRQVPKAIEVLNFMSFDGAMAIYNKT